MENTFLFISLLLHGVSFIFLFLLYQKVQQLKGQEDDLDQRMKEVDDIFHSYLLEIKDENKRLLEQIAEAENTTPIEKPNEISGTPLKPMENVEEKPRHNHNQAAKEKEYDYSRNVLSITDKVDIPSIHAQVMNLYEKGYSTEEIAKKLNRGNTEVELIVKFNRKMMN